MVEKPEYLEDEHLTLLDALRESSQTNMFLAAAHLQNEFPELSRKEASVVVRHWMDTFSERDP